MSRKGAAVPLTGALITGALISGMTADPAMRSTAMRSKLRGAARHIPRASAIGEFPSAHLRSIRIRATFSRVRPLSRVLVD